MKETPVQFLGWEDLLEKGKATNSSILTWRIPWTVWPLSWNSPSKNTEVGCRFLLQEIFLTLKIDLIYF